MVLVTSQKIVVSQQSKEAQQADGEGVRGRGNIPIQKFPVQFPLNNPMRLKEIKFSSNQKCKILTAMYFVYFVGNSLFIDNFTLHNPSSETQHISELSIISLFRCHQSIGRRVIVLCSSTLNLDAIYHK